MSYNESPDIFQENIRMDANTNGGVKTTTDTDSLVTMDDIKERKSRGWVGWRSEMKKITITPSSSMGYWRNCCDNNHYHCMRYNI